jgi:uncharacterized protein (TIGR02246 family)
MEDLKTLKGTDVKGEIEKCYEKFIEAFNSGNAKGVAMNYAENAKIMPTNSDVIQGLEGIEAFWKGAMDMGLKKAEIEIIQAEGLGDTAIDEGRYKLFLGNGQLADHGKYIVIWRKVDGSWKMDLDIWNSSMPPA